MPLKFILLNLIVGFTFFAWFLSSWEHQVILVLTVSLISAVVFAPWVVSQLKNLPSKRKADRALAIHKDAHPESY